MDTTTTRDSVTRDFLLRCVRLNHHLPGCPRVSSYTSWRGTNDPERRPDCTCNLDRLASMYAITLPTTGATR